jgi:hypothetical protein
MAVMRAYPSQETSELVCSRGDPLQQVLALIEKTGGVPLDQVSFQNLVQEFGGRGRHQRQLHVPSVTRHLVAFESPALRMPANMAQILRHGVSPAGAGVETPSSRFPSHADIAVFDVANPVPSEMFQIGLDDSMPPKHAQKMGPTPAAPEANILDSVVKSAGKRSHVRFHPVQRLLILARIWSDLNVHIRWDPSCCSGWEAIQRKIPHGAEIIQID